MKSYAPLCKSKIQLSTMLIMFLLTLTLQAQTGNVYIDAENASINQSDGYINDEGRSLRWQNQGDGQNLPEIVSNIKRAGNNSIAMQINGATTGSTSQRSEYCLNACWSTSEPAVQAGDTWYTGFSFQLDQNLWESPTSWFSIQQTQQKKSIGQINNNPFVSVEIKPGNILDIRAGNGINGDSGLSFTHLETITLSKGIWYDVVVGWEFNPYNTNGWLAIWVKTENETDYVRYGIDNIKLGYTTAPQQVSQNKTGMYRARVNNTNRMYFDEVRFSNNLEGAKIPANNTLSIDENVKASNSIKIHSNPVSNGIIALANAKGFLYNIKTISGQSIQSGSIENDAINVSVLSAGMYIIQFYNNGISDIKKIIIL